MTMASAVQPSEEVVYRREQVNRELRDRQSMSANYSNASLNPAAQPASTYEPRPQLRSALRNSRYQ